MKNQSAIEFMSVIALGLTLIAIASFFGADYIISYFKDIDLINARQSVDSIVSTTSLVYAQGVGATSKVSLNLPNSIQRNRTYIYGKEINIRLYDGTSVKDVFRNTKVDVYGSIPLRGGRISLTVRMYSGGGYPNGAVLFVNDQDISLVYVRTCNDSNCNQYKDSFNSGDTIYYGIFLADSNFNGKSGNVNVAIYSEDGKLYHSQDVYIPSSGYIGNITINTPGHYLLSVMLPDTRIIGTSLFDVS